MKSQKSAAIAAWLLAAFYYFYQYTLRSSPAVMMPQISSNFSLGAAGAASLVGLFYWGYAPVSLIAGPAIDRLGARAVIPFGALMAAVGALLFGAGNLTAAQAGRFLQGAGGVFALIGAVYIVTKNFPAGSAATMVGATQMFGSSGGSAGQFLVGPAIAHGLAWDSYWMIMGVAGIAVAAALYFLLPSNEAPQRTGAGRMGPVKDLVTVFKNPQSLLCGLIAGLLFVPTTVFDMIWGVRFLQDGFHIGYGDAVLRSATIPLGWIVGSPLTGYISDRLGRRKPVIVVSSAILLGCLAAILFGPHRWLPPYVLGLATGIASGGAMVLYTVVKEVNPPQLSGTSTGVIGFLNFSLTALIGPVFGSAMERATGGLDPALVHYQMTFKPLITGVAVAILLTAIFLRETGSAKTPSAARAEAA